MASRLLLAALAAAAATFPAPVASASPGLDAGVSPRSEVEDAYATLCEEYTLAVGSWKRDVRDAEDAKARRDLRAAHPAKEFLAMFTELADGGDGRALLWIIENVDDTGGTSAARSTLRMETYERLLGEHVPGALLDDICDAMFGDRKLRSNVGIEGLEGYTKRILAHVEDPTQRATVRYGLARVLAGSKVPAESERGVKLLEELLAQHPDLPWSKAAEDLLFEMRFLRVGCIAPDFTGRTVDGDPVRLSDYRGRVVVLDFFGFW